MIDDVVLSKFHLLVFIPAISYYASHPDLFRGCTNWRSYMEDIQNFTIGMVSDGDCLHFGFDRSLVQVDTVTSILYSLLQPFGCCSCNCNGLRSLSGEVGDERGLE
jgi:hypothetical protein